MAARFVSSVSTMRVARGLTARYLFTVFFDSPTLTVRTSRPLSLYSLFSLSTMGASSKQYGHQVVQNSSSTTLPLTDSFVNFSPVVVLVLNRGARSRVFGPAYTARLASSRTQEKTTRRVLVRGFMCALYPCLSALSITS